MNFWPKGKHLMKKVALLIVFMENEIKVGMKKKKSYWSSFSSKSH